MFKHVFGKYSPCIKKNVQTCIWEIFKARIGKMYNMYQKFNKYLEKDIQKTKKRKIINEKI